MATSRRVFLFLIGILLGVVSGATSSAQTLHCNGPPVEFEGSNPPDWVVGSLPPGIYWSNTSLPACEIPNLTNGSGEAACADSDAAGAGAPPYDTSLYTNSFDLSGWGAAVLEVKAYYRDITTGANDRFEVDVSDGVTWTTLLSWDEDHEPEDFALNLSAYAGLPDVRVRFHYFGDGYDWYAQVDDVQLVCVPPGSAAIQVDPAFLTASQGPDVVTSDGFWIINAGAGPLNWNIVEDDSACDSPVDIPWLSVAPDTGTTIPLGGGPVFDPPGCFPGVDDPCEIVNDPDVVVSFDSTGLAPGDYTANLCVNSDDPDEPIVQVQVSLTVLDVEALECNGDMIDFEGGIPSGWTVVDNTGGTGLVWTTTDDPACEIPNRTNGSGEAACADSDAAGYPAVPYDTELWSPLIDLSAVGAVVLDVKAYYNDINTGTNDRFEVDVWDGSSWTNELSWDEDHMPEDFTLNLSAYAGLSGVRIRFHYFGNGYDWYAQVDDLALTCAAIGPPVIQVDPATLASTQGLDRVVVLSDPGVGLTVTNAGGSPLHWNVMEDDSACDSPTDIPWLSVAPSTGATAPLDSTVAAVTFDSTGLAPGDYSANLCVDSDDPVTPVVQVPVALTVTPPVTLACNGEVAGFEGGIPSGWSVIDNEGFGVEWSDIATAGEVGNYTGGAGDAATVSSERAGPVPFDTELRTAPFDLSGWLPGDTISLTFLANYQNYAARDFLEVDISVDGGVTWTTLLSWNEDHGVLRNLPGESVSIDLSPFAGLGDLTLRWHYYDPTTEDYDWYAQIDDVALLCETLGPCDVDGDGDVDLGDINLIVAARNTPATGPDDPRDFDGDGMITVLDARQCVLQCTNPRCVP
jgi:hypothetical protein